MISPALPHTAVIPVLRLPPATFFESQSTFFASDGAGDLTLDDFNLSLDSAPGHWTAFVYKTSAKAMRKVLRIFVYGEIMAIENRFAESTSGPAAVQIQRITLQRPALSTESASSVFRNDVVMLSNVIAIEQSPKCRAVDKWVFIADRARPEDGHIFLECGPSTHITSGPLCVGARALFDVTLHRVDSYPACDTVHKAYSLLTHTAELVPNSFLQRTGWILPDLSAMPVDEAIAVVHSEMERMRV